MDLVEALKFYGPMSLGWVVSAYLLKFILDRYVVDIDARVKLAGSLDKLTDAVLQLLRNKGGQ